MLSYNLVVNTVFSTNLAQKHRVSHQPDAKRRHCDDRDHIPAHAPLVAVMARALCKGGKKVRSGARHRTIRTRFSQRDTPLANQCLLHAFAVRVCAMRFFVVLPEIESTVRLVEVRLIVFSEPKDLVAI